MTCHDYNKNSSIWHLLIYKIVLFFCVTDLQGTGRRVTDLQGTSRRVTDLQDTGRRRWLPIVLNKRNFSKSTDHNKPQNLGRVNYFYRIETIRPA